MSLIIFLGVVSLFGDMTYEGARSVIGPYLGMLGANASVVGLVTGIGEMSGYAVRLASGYVADRTKAYWLLTFVGYGLLLSVPLLALAGSWQLAALFIILERVGKAIRSPARDTILSYATRKVGRGWGFALHEALDQVGAIAGPILLSLVFLSQTNYRQGFALLGLPALLTLVTLGLAKRKFPSPYKLEAGGTPREREGKGKLPRVFWLYTTFTLLSAAGFANFPLISYHLKIHSIIPDAQIPLIYSIAMAVDALAALLTGKIYDRHGVISSLAIPLLTLPIPVLTFSNNPDLVLAGIVIWGTVLGIQETIMRAAVADIVPAERRGSAYGVFNAVYGASLFWGSALMGLLYELSINRLVIFAIVMELISIPLFFQVRRAA